MIEKPDVTNLPAEDIKEGTDDDDHDLKVEINNSFTGFLCDFHALIYQLNIFFNIYITLFE